MDFNDLTKADANKTQGVIKTYNDQSVDQLPMYYDRTETDKTLQTMFDNALKGLSDLNNKLKDEVGKDEKVFKKVDLSIDKVE